MENGRWQSWQYGLLDGDNLVWVHSSKFDLLILDIVVKLVYVYKGNAYNVVIQFIYDIDVVCKFLTFDDKVYLINS